MNTPYPASVPVTSGPNDPERQRRDMEQFAVSRASQRRGPISFATSFKPLELSSRQYEAAPVGTMANLDGRRWRKTNSGWFEHDPNLFDRPTDQSGTTSAAPAATARRTPSAMFSQF